MLLWCKCAHYLRVRRVEHITITLYDRPNVTMNKYAGRTEYLTNLVPEPRDLRTDVRRGACRDVTLLISAGRRAGSPVRCCVTYRAGGRCVGEMSVDRSVWRSYPKICLQTTQFSLASSNCLLEWLHCILRRRKHCCFYVVIYRHHDRPQVLRAVCWCNLTLVSPQ